MSKKLVIRINNLHDLEPNDNYEPPEETIIRWDRVMGVGVIVLIVGCLISWGAWQMLSASDSDEKQTLVLTEANTSQAPLAAEGQSIQVDPAIQPKPEPGFEPETAQQPESIEKTGVNNHPISDSAVVLNQTELPSVMSNVTDSVSGAATNNEIASTGVEKAAVNDAAVTDIAENALEASKTSVKQSSPNPVTIQSPSIVRAQLTRNVKKREPVDELGSTISMEGEGLIKVYLFTDMKDLKGETLYHSWYLGDKRMAKVRIKVRNNDVVASSSKFIDKYMLGHWTVSVANSRGNELVSAGFEVVR